MKDNLYFEPGWYKITKLWPPNVLEVEDTWFIKLKGVGDDTPKEELTKWLKENYMVRVIPYRRDNTARIISDVWLGNTHINRQFTNYKMDNFIQAFKRWHDSIKANDTSSVMKVKEELAEAFHIAWVLIPSPLQKSFIEWRHIHSPHRRITAEHVTIEERIKRKNIAIKNTQNRMIKNFYEWKEQQK